MKKYNIVVIQRMKLGGFNVQAEELDQRGVVPPKGAVTTLEEALEIAGKLMEDEV